MALNKELVHKIRRKHGDERIILSLEEKAFCVSLQKDGTTLEREARDVSEFMGQISASQVAWVDYIVEDLRRDACDVAKSLGFSGNVTSALIKADRAGYEDLDTELGLLIPAIIVSGFDVKIEYLLILMRSGLVVTIHTT